ncbi:hypothetical protein [Amycolatopsis sp. NPDC051102]|uniref:hypothetical protein n=1 Tax=Amycolatopsis sp. NPDC051102 TaxID=3155163 RepID=UPI0034361630
MSRPLPGVFDQALASAVRAPSPHNTQPWRFAVGPEAIEVWLDRERVLAVADPHGREARLACGAAAFTCRSACGPTAWPRSCGCCPIRPSPTSSR